MEIQIELFDQNTSCYISNCISDIVLSNKYKISVNELFEYLQTKKIYLSTKDKLIKQIMQVEDL
jgi:hypothetical protein